MPLLPVTISDGQVSGVDSLSSAASSVLNWQADEAGINRPRPGLAAYSLNGLTTTQVVALERFPPYTVLIDSARKFQYIADVGPGTARDASTSSTATQLEGTSRPTWVVGREYIYAAGGGRIQRWNNTIGLSEALSSSPSCTHIASIGQYLIANDVSNPNRYKWSDIGEGVWTTWPTANFSTVTGRAEIIVGLFESLGRLYVFGGGSLQIYEVGSDPTLPFDLVASTDSGLAAPYAFTRLDRQVAFLDHRRRIVIGDGVSGEPVSSAIDKDIRGFSTISDCFMYREDIGQHSSLVVRFPTELRTFVLDLKGQKWSERKGYTAPFLSDYPVSAYVYRSLDNAHILGSTSTTGALYTLSTSSRQDLSGPLVCERTTGWHDFGTQNRKRSNGVTAVLRRGTAAEGDTPGAYEVRVQNDDGPWSPWQQISIGTPSQYEQRRKAYFGGLFGRRRYCVRVSTSEDTSLVSLHDDITDTGRP